MPELREAPTVEQALETHLYNMRVCGQCMIRNRALIEALEAIQDAEQ